MTGRDQRGGEQLVEQDRRIAVHVDVDADVELARHRFQPPMAVAVQVDRAAVLSVPAPERVMAQDEPPAGKLDLGIIGDARPSGRGERRIGIVVAAQQVLGAVEP